MERRTAKELNGVGDCARFRLNAKGGQSGREVFARVKKVHPSQQPSNPSFTVVVLQPPSLEGTGMVLGGGTQVVD